MKSRNLFHQFFSGTILPALLLTSALLMISFTGENKSNKTTYAGESASFPQKIQEYGMQESVIKEVRAGIVDAPSIYYVRWKGDFHYSLNYRDGIYESPVEFLKMKGLRGETSERIEVTGQLTFTQAKKSVKGRIFDLPGHFAGKGTASYTIARMSLSRLGEGQVVHLIDGKGQDQIRRNREDTYLKINRASKSYSIRITPGSYEADIDAFGVKVLASSEMKVTKAFIEKMESENRPVLYPEALKKMFPEYQWYPDRDNIVLEAFDIPLPSSTQTLSGSYEDEKGGILSWKFVAF